MILLIPLGGIGKRFSDQDYNLPKGLIKALGKPILYYVLENLNLDDIEFVYIPYNKEYAPFRFESKLIHDFPNIRFYAGTQLQTPTGYNIGTLCVISDKPKKLTSAQRKALDILGREVIAQLELRLKNKKLELANKRKAEFLANVSHELRTPLNAIIGLSELSLSHASADSMDTEIHGYLQQINRSGTKLIGIINSVLELRKIEAGKI